MSFLERVARAYWSEGGLFSVLVQTVVTDEFLSNAEERAFVTGLEDAAKAALRRARWGHPTPQLSYVGFRDNTVRFDFELEADPEGPSADLLVGVVEGAVRASYGTRVGAEVFGTPDPPMDVKF